MKRLDTLSLLVLALGGFTLMATMVSGGWHHMFAGETDFLSFYAGGKLAFSPGLYDLRQVTAIQEGVGIGLGLCFIRMPWFAAAVWPLAHLSYHAAFWIWQGLLVGGFAVFLFLWPKPALQWRLVIVGWSLTSMMSFQIAQDPALLLAVMAISLHLIRKNEPLIAGLVLSLVLAKFHLFLPLFPAVLLARRWKFAAGLYSGSAFLVGISFLVDGHDWIQRFVSATSNGIEMVKPPSLYPWLGAHLVLFGIAAVAILGAYLWRASHDLEFLIAAAPVAIIPLLSHVGMYDCPLLLPVAMVALARGSRTAKVLGFLLVCPFTYFLHFTWIAWLVPVVAVALLVTSAAERPLKTRKETRRSGYRLHLTLLDRSASERHQFRTRPRRGENSGATLVHNRAQAGALCPTKGSAQR